MTHFSTNMILQRFRNHSPQHELAPQAGTLAVHGPRPVVIERCMSHTVLSDDDFEAATLKSWR
jgi:hypothetical protein